jgi:hypothetical protein
VGDNRFRAGAVEVTFTEDGIEMRRPGSPRPVRFERRPPATVSRQALEAYVGEYYSADVDARYRVTSGDSTLTFVTGTTEAITARPVFADGFRALGYTIQFVRRGSRITGFEVTDGRMRRVPFSRVPSDR